MLVDVIATAGNAPVWEERLLEQTTDVLRPEDVVPGTIIVTAATTAGARGDLLLVRGAKEENGELMLDLTPLTSGRKHRLKFSELQRYRPLVVVTPLTVPTYAVEEGAIYQTSDGVLVKCVNKTWRRLKDNSPITLSIFPELLLRVDAAGNVVNDISV